MSHYISITIPREFNKKNKLLDNFLNSKPRWLLTGQYTFQYTLSVVSTVILSYSSHKCEAILEINFLQECLPTVNYWSVAALCVWTCRQQNLENNADET